MTTTREKPTEFSRDIQLRALDTRTTDEGYTFTGIAVPWNQPARCYDWWEGTYEESFERGAVEDSDEALIFWRHEEPIGKITSHRDADGGWEITATISDTPRGTEAATLLRDGVIDRLSVGFEPREQREIEPASGELKQIIRTKVRVREISLVPFPAYDGAKITEVREEPTIKDTRMDSDNAPTNTDILQRMDDLERSFKLSTQTPDEAPTSTRSAGQALKAMYTNDADAIAEYTALRSAAFEGITEARAYTGATLADAVAKASWVGDLTRIVNGADPLSDLFSTGVLPATGMSIEFGRLKSDTTSVTKQATEGTDLSFGKVVIESATATIETFGGYTELSQQLIERASVSYLDTALNALALRAGKAKALARRQALAAAVTAQTTATNTVNLAANTFVGWFSAIVDAAEKYEDLGLSMSDVTITADKATFKTLGSLVDSAGRPLFNVFGEGVNAIGSVNPAVATDLNVGGVKMRLNTKQAAAGAAFTHPLAIRSYHSPVVSLQDGNIINLTKQASVYFYGAFADEIPAAIVPVKTTA